MRDLMFKYFVVAFMCILFASSVVHADGDSKSIRGYGKTAWGMTPSEVLKVEKPRAVLIENPEKYNSDFGRISINGIKIGITEFNAIFLFDEKDRLVQVNIKNVEKNQSTNSFIFYSVLKLLTEKYGTPTYNDDHEAFWKMKHTTIYLKFLDLPLINISEVIVSYQSSARSQSYVRDL